jgi:putative two-component system response regulator
MEKLAEPKERVLVIDDDRDSLMLLGRILTAAGYRCTLANDAAEARERLATAPFDLMLCGVLQPGDTGLDLVEHELAHTSQSAALMVNGLEQLPHDDDRALAVGAYGYLVKPFRANEVLQSVLSALRRRQHDAGIKQELESSREETIQRLCTAVEARDPASAAHINQMSEYCGAIARELGLPSARCDLIRSASAMHDVGKIGIPDRVLLKPGPLTAEERRTIETHAAIGHGILTGSHSELLQLAAEIAWTHHEQLDGGGYPRGISGSAIPLEGRIAAVADVFDALTRDRVYRRRMSRIEALAILEAGRGRHFDPLVLDALLIVLEGTPTAAGAV